MIKRKYDKTNTSRLYEIAFIALPVTLQTIFQASYSLIDQLMVGTLGTISIAASGLVGKFSGLATFTIGGIVSVSSILISQYYGNKDDDGIRKSYSSCLLLSLLLILLFILPSILIPANIIGIYTIDQQVIQEALSYFKMIGLSFLPMTGTMMISSYFRSIEKSKYPMYTSVFAIFCNILFNYLFIFGAFGFPKLGLLGAGIGTLLSRCIECLLLWIFKVKIAENKTSPHSNGKTFDFSFYKKIILISLPILFNEFSWSIGENIYAILYGRLGTTALAAMSLTNPLQGMFIGMFSGLSAAAVVLIGKRLGQNHMDDAYSMAKLLIRLGFLGSILISIVLIVIAPIYVTWFKIEQQVATTAIYIIYALAAILFAKVLNMIVGGGILRSGGQTHYTLFTDLIGTWIFGVPLGILCTFLFHLPVYWVYFILSLEEVVRLIISIIIFNRKNWMRNITTE